MPLTRLLAVLVLAPLWGGSPPPVLGHCAADVPPLDVVAYAGPWLLSLDGDRPRDDGEPSHEPATRPVPIPASGPPAGTEPPPPVAGDPVSRLLVELEDSARDLRAFTADVHFETEDAFLGQKIIRKGRLIYRVAPDGRKSFAIIFDRTVENGQSRRRRTHYVFDGGWLAEIDHANRQFIKRQIVRPGETFDPLKLGEGPIPLPIGQPAAEVRRRFEVAALALPATGALRKLDPALVDGMRLVPRAGTPLAEEHQRVDLFYDRATRLPAGIEVIERNGDRKTARLTALRRNPVLSETDLGELSVEVPGDGWKVDVGPLAR